MYFLVQIKHSTAGQWTKGVVVKETLDAARQSFHAYLGAYGYGQEPITDFVECVVLDMTGRERDCVVDNRIAPAEEPAEE